MMLLQERFFIEKQSGVVQLNFVQNSDGTSATNTSAVVAWTPSTGVWYHVAVVYTAAAGSAAFYVDGVQQGSTQTGLGTSTHNSTAVFTLGLADLSDAALRTLNGRLCLARYWSSARTVTEISNNKCIILGSTEKKISIWTNRQRIYCN